MRSYAEKQRDWLIPPASRGDSDGIESNTKGFDNESIGGIHVLPKWRFNKRSLFAWAMDIDLEHLRNYVKQLKADRQDSPIGRVKSGATEVIRRNLKELERMHQEDGATWTEIAAGLAAQGVTQGNGQPITGRRLTALMHNIRVQEERSLNREPKSEAPDDDLQDSS